MRPCLRLDQVLRPSRRRRPPSSLSPLLHYKSHSQSSPSNPQHHDLQSFLDYAKRVNLSPASTTYIGTHYEYTVQSTLRRRFGFSLSRVGGRDDSGIDLLGTWHLPSLPILYSSSAYSPSSLRVIVQCKALRSKLGPNLVRELEGAFAGAPSGWRGAGVLGILVSPKNATKGVREAMGRSRWAMGWVMLEDEGCRRGNGDGGEAGDGDGNGRVRQVLWNRAAAGIGLEGVTVTMRYGGSGGEKPGEVDGECVLLWKDKPIEGIADG